MATFNYSFADRTLNMNPSAIRELLKIVARPEIISFAGGMPAPELFPYEALERAAAKAVSTPQKAFASFQYGASEGYQPLRELIAEQLAAEGIRASAQQILITTGSQQAIDMIAKAFLNDGDQVVVGRPTFLGALQSFNAYHPTYLQAPVDQDGVMIEPFEALLAHNQPKLIYAIPNYQNPTGLSESPTRKRELYDVAKRYGVPLIEDDPYGELYFTAERPFAVKSLDDGDGVMLLRTFSKVLAPGLRVGYAVLPEPVFARVLPIKQAADLHTSAFNQVLIHELLVSGELDAHLDRLREVYRHRRDVMLEAMAEHFPPEAHWTRPDGGLFIWVTLPEGVSSAALLEVALQEHKVAFIPGSPFFTDGSGANTFRLNFSCASEAMIRDGIAKLGRLLRSALPKAASLT